MMQTYLVRFIFKIRCGNDVTYDIIHNICVIIQKYSFFFSTAFGKRSSLPLWNTKSNYPFCLKCHIVLSEFTICLFVYLFISGEVSHMRLSLDMYFTSGDLAIRLLIVCTRVYMY